MIIPMGNIKLTEEQLNIAREIAIHEFNDVASNLEIFSDAIMNTYLFKDFNLMKYFHEYLISHNIPQNGCGLSEERLQQLFFHYHIPGSED